MLEGSWHQHLDNDPFDGHRLKHYKRDTKTMNQWVFVSLQKIQKLIRAQPVISRWYRAQGQSGISFPFSVSSRIYSGPVMWPLDLLSNQKLKNTSSLLHPQMSCSNVLTLHLVFCFLEPVNYLNCGTHARTQHCFMLLGSSILFFFSFLSFFFYTKLLHKISNLDRCALLIMHHWIYK